MRWAFHRGLSRGASGRTNRTRTRPPSTRRTVSDTPSPRRTGLGVDSPANTRSMRKSGIYVDVDVVFVDLLLASAEKFDSGTAAQTRR